MYDHEATRATIKNRRCYCTCGEPVSCVAIGPVYLHDAEILAVERAIGDGQSDEARPTEPQTIGPFGDVQ